MIKMPATTKAGGMATAMPDVCFVPAPPPVNQVPTPFPNIGMWAGAEGVADKVLIENKEVVVQTSKIPNSKGDEAGTRGGVVSGVNMKEVLPRKASSKVLIQGKGVVHLTVTTSHNGTNANNPAGVHSVPSQAKVLVGM